VGDVMTTQWRHYHYAHKHTDRTTEWSENIIICRSLHLLGGDSKVTLYAAQST